MADSKAQAENTCHCCLYLKPPPDARQATRGNCSLHKEWIDSAARTTCSEMSKRHLQRGNLPANRTDPRRVALHTAEDRIRTRLFLVSKGRKGEGLNRTSQAKLT